MKKNLLLLLISFLYVTASAQNSLPNGNFETWIEATYDYPQNYPYTSNPETFFRFDVPFNSIKTSDSYHGDWAVQLTTYAGVGDTSGGYFVNSPYTDGPVWHGGIPITETPTGIRGYYKYNVATADKGLFVVAFSKNSVNIGTYFFPLEGIHDTYTLFDFTFDPALSDTPDEVLIGATSSDLVLDNYIPGSILKIDSITFKGVTSQPALLNGDFEIWESATIRKPTGWYSQEKGIKRTTASYSGNYAAELTTFLTSDQNNNIVAREGSISTGYYSNACNCMQGGYPYTETNDALVLYYKYIPSVSTDRATVNLSFKKDGVEIGWYGSNLSPSADYQYVEMPFDIGSIPPDEVILDIRSSQYGNQTADYAGAVLLVDEIAFKSQLTPAGVEGNLKNNDISVFPNPSTGKFTIYLDDSKLLSAESKIEIYNGTGQKILSSKIKDQKINIDISGSPNGIYMVNIYDGQAIYTSKIVKR